MSVDKRKLTNPLPSAARTTSGQSAAIDSGQYGKASIIIDITAVSGSTPTLDVKLQGSPDGTRWFDISGGAFSQRTATGKDVLESIDYMSFQKLRVDFVIGGGTPSFTFQVDVGLGQ